MYKNPIMGFMVWEPWIEPMLGVEWEEFLLGEMYNHLIMGFMCVNHEPMLGFNI